MNSNYPNGRPTVKSLYKLHPNPAVGFEFEKLDYISIGAYIHEKQHWIIYVTLIYITVIFGIQYLMKNRKPFVLKKELFLWNAALGLFSFIGLIRSAPGFFDAFLQPGGLYKSLCVSTWSNPSLFWGLMFTLSKYVELGDTVFIVLRKKPLLFIQWYHHCGTLAVAWITTPYAEPIIKCVVILNFTVHSIMYPYFAAKSLDLKVPRIIAKTITTVQLIQMFLGLFINIYTAYMYYTETGCYRHPESILSFIVLYGSFVVLFGQLFYNLIVVKKQKIP